MKENYYMNIAIREAMKAAKKGEIPVGAVIVENDKIISKAHNLKDTKKVVTRHAEIIAIERANKLKKDWRLSDCVIYITLQPCKMCLAAIEQARIKKIVYGINSINNYNIKKTEVKRTKNTETSDKCKIIIDDFFKKIRSVNKDQKE